ncbi:MAG TPA: hypothetical protein VKN76_18005 [Kiloniellaceae bacterium]|nr:hypothetical protein [Kiloniellaceae bacterium]
MIKALIWLVVAYVFGILGFGLASLMSSWGTSDLVTAFSDAFIFGATWPATVVDLLTGNLKH